MNVTVGVTNDRYVGIRSGLREGDQVIYAGYENLKDNDPVVPTRWGTNGALILPPATGEVAAGTVYTCPMHPDVRRDRPGDCPRCGMRLVPVPPSSGGNGATPPAASSGGSAAPGNVTRSPGIGGGR